MRILLLGDYPRDPRLGSTKVLLKLQEEFRALGHTCDVLLADDLGASPRHRVLRWAIGPAMALAAVRRAFREHGPYDVVDVASAEGAWVGALRRVGLFNRAAVISRSNGLEHLDYRRMLEDHGHGLCEKPWTRRIVFPALRLSQVAAAARIADRLILLNESDREFALARGWKNRADIDVVSHGISSAFLDDTPPPDAARGKGILFCGSWADVKGTPYLARAFSDLIGAGTRANLTILGGGVAEGIIRSAFASETRPYVTVQPRVSESEVMTAYRTHDVLAAPSTYEGFGMVVIEAMSQRLPVVTTPVGCARTLVANDCTGLIVPPRDAGALTAALRRAMDDAALRRRLAHAAFEAVRQMTWTKAAEATIAAYEKARVRNADA